MKRPILSLLSLTALMLSLAFAAPLTTSAITRDSPDGGGSSSSTSTKNSSTSTTQSDNGTDQYVDPAFTHAADCNSDSCGIISNYVNPTIKLLTILVGIAATIGIIFGAIEVMISAGDPQRAASGKNHIRNAIIGLVAYIFLFALLQWLLPGGIV